MSLMSFVGDMLGPVLEVFGGKRDRQHSWQMMEDQQEFQREMAKMGIQWRVADAEAAGVHPLYALGASVPSGSPISVGGSDMAGSFGRLGSAVGKLFDSDLRKRAELELKILENRARVSEVEATAAEAGLATSRQRTVAQPPMPSYFSEGESAPYRPVGEPGTFQLEPGMHHTLPGYGDVVKVEPSEQRSVESGKPHLEAAVSAGSKRYRLTQNMEVLLPAANDLGEALEPLSESMVMMYVWYRLNVQEFGPHFADLAFQELGFPRSLLRTLKGLQGWEDWSNLKPPAVRYRGPGNPLLPRLPRMIHEGR